MSDSPVYRPHDEAPARGAFRAIAPKRAWTGLDTRSFEYVSRGDFVSGRIHLPASAGSEPAPLVLLTHAAEQSSDSPSIDFAADWVHRGFAVAAIDLPLHGHRASPKLSARLFRGLDDLALGRVLDADSRALVEEFARQSTSDLIRALDALGALPEVDGARIGLVGLGIGATTSAYVLAHDPRPGACVLVGGTGRFEDPGLDPASRLATQRTCPILVVSFADDRRVAPDAIRALFEAAAEPKTFSEVAGGGAEMPPEVSGYAADFLAAHLELVVQLEP